jgi:hypothetical protein
MEEEEIQPPKFHHRFDDDPFENLKNTSDSLDVQLGKEPSSVQIQKSFDKIFSKAYGTSLAS